MSINDALFGNSVLRLLDGEASALEQNDSPDSHEVLFEILNVSLLLSRSVMENSSRNSSSMAIKMLARGARGVTGLGQTIVVNIPYIRSDIPILVLFRALGYVADKDILDHIVYNFEDTEMMEALRPSIEEAFPVQDQNVYPSDHLETEKNAGL